MPLHPQPTECAEKTTPMTFIPHRVGQALGTPGPPRHPELGPFWRRRSIARGAATILPVRYCCWRGRDDLGVSEIRQERKRWCALRTACPDTVPPSAGEKESLYVQSYCGFVVRRRKIARKFFDSLELVCLFVRLFVRLFAFVNF